MAFVKKLDSGGYEGDIKKSFKHFDDQKRKLAKKMSLNAKLHFPNKVGGYNKVETRRAEKKESPAHFVHKVS